jgi:hypothetical protein
MKKFKRTRTVSFSWDNVDPNTTSEETFEDLEEHAWDRIAKMENESFTSGELNLELCIDGKDVMFIGWWTSITIDSD